MDISAVSTEDLRARFVVLGEQLREVTAERKRLSDELVRRERMVSAQVRLSAMSEDDKATLRGVLS